MASPSDHQLIQRWENEPAPLLPLLHAFHDRDGHLSDEALRAVSKGLRIPLADLFGTVTFYHHFAREEGGLDLLEALRGAGATAMPCAGRCDDPVPVLRGDAVLVGDSVENLAARTSPLPPEVEGGLRAGAEECVFRHIREPGRTGLEGYRATGGYSGLQEAMLQGTPEDVLDAVDRSGLAGRGGAGFPTGRKWRAVAQAAGGPRTIVCNADEGEPGCFKDRALMDHDPHAVIEGMIAAGFATGAPRGFIYLRYEYPETMAILEGALAECEEAGILGDEVFGTEFSFRIYVRRGAGAYICGEETSLLNSLEGKHPFPRNRPPFPVTHGFEGTPTVVNNVETFASVGPILAHGPDWYQGLGRGDLAGTKVISLSGDVLRPGNYEVPMGLPLRELIHDWAGGPGEGRSLQAVTMAGLSGGFLGGADLDVTLDEPTIRSRGSFLGAGGIMVFDDTRDMVEVARQAMDFFRHESCGKCFPCRIGTQRLVERLGGSGHNGGSGYRGPDGLEPWLDEVRDLGTTMKGLSACGLGMAAPLLTESLVRYWPDQVERHVREANP
jgi:NADH-quinone oxidoreductase subunit F